MGYYVSMPLPEKMKKYNYYKKERRPLPTFVICPACEKKNWKNFNRGGFGFQKCMTEGCTATLYI